MQPQPLPDLEQLVPPRRGDPLTLEYRAMADYWRRLASLIANAVGDPLVEALYFDRHGVVVAMRAGGIDLRDGKQISEPPGWRWWCSNNGAAELANHAAWAEYVFAAHVGMERARPPGDMPHRVAGHVQQAKTAAEHVRARQ